MRSGPGRSTSWSGTRRGFPAKTRARILRAHPDCQLGYPGCTFDSTEADHIVNHATARRLGWPDERTDSEENGQGVCKSCHRVKTAREIREGQALAKKQKPRTRPQRKHPGER